MNADRPADGARSDAGTASDALTARMAEASALSDQGHWREAFELLLREEPSHPDDPTLLCMLGVAAREVGVPSIAYDFFRRCIAQDPQDPLLLTTAGQAIAEWDDADAERVLRLAALTAPALGVARMNYGAYLAREGLFDAAIVELEAARALDPEEPAVRYELGVAYLLADRQEEGIDEVGEALALAPDDGWTQAVLGLALFDAGRTDESAEQLHDASLTRVEDWELQAAAALAAAGEGWLEQAWDAVARADLVANADAALLREVEERIELGEEAARRFLRDELAPGLLRSRLLARD